jgi:hypothetical protein
MMKTGRQLLAVSLVLLSILKSTARECGHRAGPLRVVVEH